MNGIFCLGWKALSRYGFPRRLRSAVLFGCLSGFVFAGLSACSGQWNAPDDAKQAKNPVPSNTDTLADASQIYQDHCAHCHGVKGDSKRPGSSFNLSWVKPTNFTDTKIMDAMTDGEIFWKITTGNRPMPGFEAQLSDYERWELVDFLRTIAHPPAKRAQASSTPTP